MLTGHPPFPWQRKLYEEWFQQGAVPTVCNLPTGLGKTSVIAVWLIALVREASVPRRLVYVVNRRTVVDQATNEAIKIRDNGTRIGMDSLAISTLRGQFADNREWSADPARPAVICGTVDMIGSRLLFAGYRIGFRSRPMHAGFLGQDALLVHDEAHLEPAFQTLIETIRAEQKDREKTGNLPWPKLRIMALSATTRDASRSGASVLSVTDEDERHPLVKQRIEARKQLRPHECKNEKTDLAGRVADLSVVHEESGDAILVFVRMVDDVANVLERLTKSGVERHRIETLTGTMRGYERDHLVRSNPVFARFLPSFDRSAEVDAARGTVYLVCTSAGEVGVNISADHMVCDLSTVDSMIQRLGRVNRFGDRDDTRVDLVYPIAFEKNEASGEVDAHRQATLKHLRRLPSLGETRYDASPKALGDLIHSLTKEQREAAFAPEPTILPATDILFDAWALTTIRDKMPGRPPVAPYLHGVIEWEPPRTSVAWREEVGRITDELIGRYGENLAQDLLEDWPLKWHELLSDRTDRIYEVLQALLAEPKESLKGDRRRAAMKRALSNAEASIWLVDESNSVTVTTLGKLLDDHKKSVIDRLADAILVLPPSIGGQSAGMLNAKSDQADDVSNHWLDEHGNPRRGRVWDEDPPPTYDDNGKTRPMALIRTIDTDPLAEENAPADDGVEAASTRKRFWHWYTRPRDAEDVTRASARPITWDHHTCDVVEGARQIVNNLKLPGDLKQALILAAELHDLGKKREIWQRSIGNPNPADWHAKPGKPLGGQRWQPRHLSDYRHEFGSLLDALDTNGGHASKFAELRNGMQDVILHLIAAHHGYARPNFPPAAYDHERYSTQQNQDIAQEVMRRYARLQRRYGRWGLAYLESLLRAADWAASANPSPIDTVHEVVS